MSTRHRFTALEVARARELTVEISSLVIAGWTGRDSEALEHHIRELEAIGVPRPRTVPLFYRAAADALTTAAHIQVLGAHSTGEAEVALLHARGELWVGIGSDHTDRELEKHSVPLSKQVCAKPIGRTLWRHADVADHWDELVLRSYAHVRGERRLYQEGSVASIRPPVELIRRYADACGASSTALAEGTVMFCGTLPVCGKIEFAERLDIELEDPRLARSLRHTYDIEALPPET